MSKRFGLSDDPHSNHKKKQKLESNLDDLWGDDLDVNDVDDCLMLATLCQDQQSDIQLTQRNNVSILPSYNKFQHPSKQIFSSTQSNPDVTVDPIFPATNGAIVNATITTSNYHQSQFKRTQSFVPTKTDVVGLELKVKKLEEQFEAKIGEVSILRSQLQNIRTHNEQEQRKLKKEWDEKLLLKRKQLEGAETELQFKNLEIINLTQKLKDVAKLTNNNLDASIIRSQSFKKPKKLDGASTNLNETRVGPVGVIAHKIQLPILSTKYPLRNGTTQFTIFALTIKEMCVMDVNGGFTCANIQRKLFKTQPTINLIPVCDKLNDGRTCTDLSSLINCNAYQLELAENQEYVDKLLSLSEHLLRNLQRFLQEFETYVQCKDKLVINLESLLVDDMHNLDKRKHSENEMGINAKQSIMCITAILPYSTNVKQFMSLSQNTKEATTNNYLSLILALIKLINKLNISVNLSGFLDAVIKLLNKIVKKFNIEKTALNDIICAISKEIIVCDIPRDSVLLSFLEFLNSAVRKTNFLKQCCTFSTRKKIQLEHRKKLHYTEDSCVLLILFVVLEEYLKHNVNRLQFEESVARLFSNCIMHNREWLSHKNDKCCACVSNLVKLYVNIIYKLVQRVYSESCEYAAGEMNQQYSETLKTSINTLHTLNFTVYDILEGIVPTYSQFNAIVKSLMDLKGVLKLTNQKVEVLENLYKSKEIPKIPEEQFIRRNRSVVR